MSLQCDILAEANAPGSCQGCQAGLGWKVVQHQPILPTPLNKQPTATRLLKRPGRPVRLGMAWPGEPLRRGAPTDAYLQPTHLLRTGVLLANDRWPFEFNFDRDRSRTPALAGADTTSRLFPFQPIISDLSGTTSSVIKLAIIISSRRCQEQ